MPRNNQKARKRLRLKAGARVRVSDLAAKYPDFLRLMRARDGRTFWELSANLRVDCGAMLYLDSAPIIAKKGFHIDACSQSLLSGDGGKVQRKLVTPLDPQGSPLKHEWLSDLVSVARLSEGNGAPVIVGVSQDVFIPEDFFGLVVYTPTYWWPEELCDTDGNPSIPADLDALKHFAKLMWARVFAHFRANGIRTVRSMWSPWDWEFGGVDPSTDESRQKRAQNRTLFRSFVCALRDYGMRPRFVLYSLADNRSYPWTQFSEEETPEGVSQDDRRIPDLSRVCQGERGPARFYDESEHSSDTYADVPSYCRSASDPRPGLPPAPFDQRVSSKRFDDFACVVREMIDEATANLGGDQTIDLEVGGEFEICCDSGTPAWDANAYQLAIFTRIIWEALHGPYCPGRYPALRANVRYLGTSAAPKWPFFTNDPFDVDKLGRCDWCTWMTKLFCWSNEVAPSGHRSVFDPPEDQPICRRIYFDAISINAYYTDSDPTVPAPLREGFANAHCWEAAWPPPGPNVPLSCCGPRSDLVGMNCVLGLITSMGPWPDGAAMAMFVTEQGWGNVNEFSKTEFGNSDPQRWEPLQAAFEVSAHAEMLASETPLRGITGFLYNSDLMAGGAAGPYRYCTKVRFCDPGRPVHVDWFLGQTDPFEYSTRDSQSCDTVVDRMLDVGYAVPEGACRERLGPEEPSQTSRRLWECYELLSFKAFSVQARLLVGTRFSSDEQRRMLAVLGSNLCGTMHGEEGDAVKKTLRPYVHSFCRQSTDAEDGGGGIYVHQIHRRGEGDPARPPQVPTQSGVPDDPTDIFKPVTYPPKNALQADIHHMDRCLQALNLSPLVTQELLLRSCAANLPLDSWPDVVWVEELPDPLILFGGRLEDVRGRSYFASRVYCPTGGSDSLLVGARYHVNGSPSGWHGLTVDRTAPSPLPDDPNLATAWCSLGNLSEIPNYNVVAFSKKRGGGWTQSSVFPCLHVRRGDPWFEPHMAQILYSESNEESLRLYLALTCASLARTGLTGLMAGFANTNLLTGSGLMILRIWAIGIGASGQVEIHLSFGGLPVDTGCRFDIVPISEVSGVSVGIFEADLSTLNFDLAALCNGSCSVFLRINSGGQITWWPWNPHS